MSLVITIVLAILFIFKVEAAAKCSSYTYFVGGTINPIGICVPTLGFFSEDTCNGTHVISNAYSNANCSGAPFSSNVVTNAIVTCNSTPCNTVQIKTAICNDTNLASTTAHVIGECYTSNGVDTMDTCIDGVFDSISYSSKNGSCTGSCQYNGGTPSGFCAGNRLRTFTCPQNAPRCTQQTTNSQSTKCNAFFDPDINTIVPIGLCTTRFGTNSYTHSCNGGRLLEYWFSNPTCAGDFSQVRVRTSLNDACNSNKPACATVNATYSSCNNTRTTALRPFVIGECTKGSNGVGDSMYTCQNGYISQIYYSSMNGKCEGQCQQSGAILISGQCSFGSKSTFTCPQNAPKCTQPTNNQTNSNPSINCNYVVSNGQYYAIGYCAVQEDASSGVTSQKLVCRNNQVFIDSYSSSDCSGPVSSQPTPTNIEKECNKGLCSDVYLSEEIIPCNQTNRQVFRNYIVNKPVCRSFQGLGDSSAVCQNNALTATTYASQDGSCKAAVASFPFPSGQCNGGYSITNYYCNSTTTNKVTPKCNYFIHPTTQQPIPIGTCEVQDQSSVKYICGNNNEIMFETYSNTMCSGSPSQTQTLPGAKGTCDKANCTIVEASIKAPCNGTSGFKSNLILGECLPSQSGDFIYSCEGNTLTSVRYSSQDGSCSGQCAEFQTGISGQCSSDALPTFTCPQTTPTKCSANKPAVNSSINCNYARLKEGPFVAIGYCAVQENGGVKTSSKIVCKNNVVFNETYSSIYCTGQPLASTQLQVSSFECNKGLCDAILEETISPCNLTNAKIDRSYLVKNPGCVAAGVISSDVTYVCQNNSLDFTLFSSKDGTCSGSSFPFPSTAGVCDSTDSILKYYCDIPTTKMTTTKVPGTTKAAPQTTMKTQTTTAKATSRLTTTAAITTMKPNPGTTKASPATTMAKTTTQKPNPQATTTMIKPQQTTTIKVKATTTKKPMTTTKVMPMTTTKKMMTTTKASPGTTKAEPQTTMQPKQSTTKKVEMTTTQATLAFKKIIVTIIKTNYTKFIENQKKNGESDQEAGEKIILQLLGLTKEKLISSNLKIIIISLLEGSLKINYELQAKDNNILNTNSNKIINNNIKQVTIYGEKVTVTGSTQISVTTTKIPNSITTTSINKNDSSANIIKICYSILLIIFLINVM